MIRWCVYDQDGQLTHATASHTDHGVTRYIIDYALTCHHWCQDVVWGRCCACGSRREPCSICLDGGGVTP